MKDGGRVVVIGGGVIGAACAYYLRRGGWSVTLVDKAAFGRGCSHGNCGLVSPSHILPLAQPGAWQAALRTLLHKGSPFHIKPSWDPTLWTWLWKFQRRCNPRDMLRGGHAIKALLDSSRKLYEQLIAEERINCDWETRGCLFVLQTQAGMKHFDESVRFQREHFDVDVRRLDGDELVRFEPALKPGLAGAWWYPGDAHLRPDRLMNEWRRVLEENGVRRLENCEATGFMLHHGRAFALQTRLGTLEADQFLLAAGAWTPFLQRQLGCTIPIQPGKGYSITMTPPARAAKVPIIFDEHRVAVTPMGGVYRLGSTMEFAGYDTRLSPHRLNILREGAKLYLHEPFGEPVLEEWYGWRPMTPDSVPILGRSPALENVWLAAGHNMLGLSMSPATGKLMAELIGGATPHVDPEAYRAERFGRG